MDNKDNNVQKNEMPVMSNEGTKEETVTAASLPAEKKADETEITLPSINIANSEAADDKKPANVGTSVLDNQADFQSIFHVESEEVPEVKQADAKKLAPVVETKKEEVAALPEEKASTTEEKAQKEKIRKNNFNGEERIIYEIKEEKEGNPLVVVFYFVALIGIIFALPYISKKIAYNTDIPPVSNGSEENQIDENQLYYFNRSSVRAKIGSLEFTNFVKHKEGDVYTLSFNISNLQQKAYTFDEKYYVEFYEKEQVIYRALIYSKEIIGANSITSVKININERSYNESDSFKLREILPSSYPPANVTTVDGEYRVLTCKRLNDEVNYYFLDNKLVKLKEIYREELNNSTNYDDSIQEYYQLSQDYKKIENFNSTFISSAAEFTMINEFNYKDIPATTLNNLNEYKFFRYNENKDVVNFEMEALNYSCG